MSEELEQARATNRALNRRVQEMEREVALARRKVNAAQSEQASFKIRRERVERSLATGSWAHGSDFREACVALRAQKEGLEEEIATMKRAFADFCQDAEVVRLAVQKERERCVLLCEQAAKRLRAEEEAEAVLGVADVIRSGQEPETLPTEARR